MSRSSFSDIRDLERKDGKFRVVVAVPGSLHSEFGTTLTHALYTDSLASANAIKRQVVAEMKARLNAALRRGGKDPSAREALMLAALRSRARTLDDAEDLEAALTIRLEQIARPVLKVHRHSGGIVEEVRDPERDRQARALAETASGQATPLGHYRAEYLSQLTVKPRTRADDERALRYLEDWCGRNRAAPTLQAITRKVAMRFADGRGTVAKGKSPGTLQKYVNRLRVSWEWLTKREHVGAIVRAGVKLKAPAVRHGEEEEERPFHRDEMLKLLDGPAPPHMHDLMRIAALTGARLDAIVDLRVQDCADGVFVLKPQKKEKGSRVVPIHAALMGS